MRLSAYGSKELERCLLHLGFTPLKQHGTSHQKFIPPKEKAIHSPGQRSFIVIQLGQKEYDPHARTRYIRQIFNFGFTQEEIIIGLKK